VYLVKRKVYVVVGTGTFSEKHEGLLTYGWFLSLVLTRVNGMALPVDRAQVQEYNSTLCEWEEIQFNLRHKGFGKFGREPKFDVYTLKA
jgi:hypothetical protein